MAADAGRLPMCEPSSAVGEQTASSTTSDRMVSGGEIETGTVPVPSDFAGSATPGKHLLRNLMAYSFDPNSTYKAVEVKMAK